MPSMSNAQLTLWPVASPDLTLYLQADGRFVPLADADDSAIPYSLACAAAQALWPASSAPSRWTRPQR